MSDDASKDVAAIWAMTQSQIELAPLGLAVGQCRACGAYRSDGKPPILHYPGCTDYPDGYDLALDRVLGHGATATEETT